jgi:uncharacterized membrane protein
MRARLPWLLLTLSLALNIFFVGGAIWVKTRAGHHGRGFAERIEAAAGDLDLDAGQRQALRQFLDAWRTRTRQLREKNQPLYDAAWSELVKTQPDEAVLTRVLDETTANRRGYQLETSQALHEFLRTLSDEQRAKVLQRMRDRPGGPHRHMP